MIDGQAPDVLAEIEKRMTMNVLTQGAANHLSLTCHHLIRAELDQLSPPLHPDLTNSEFYDRYSAVALIGHWQVALEQLSGLPRPFWDCVGTGESPFCGHTLLSRHGKKLADATRRSTTDLCVQRQVQPDPIDIGLWIVELERATRFEAYHNAELCRLAVQATSEIWGVPQNLLRATITDEPEFGNIREPKTEMGMWIRQLMEGWSGAVMEDGKLYVEARAKNFGLLLNELTKGTVELVSLHGLNQLDDDVYEIVSEAADQVEFEIWMIQAGVNYYRRFLMTTPRDMTPAEALMLVAKMPAKLHLEYSLAVVEDIARAAAILREQSGAADGIETMTS